LVGSHLSPEVACRYTAFLRPIDFALAFCKIGGWRKVGKQPSEQVYTNKGLFEKEVEQWELH
jgi:hypothetical protein